MPPMSITRRDFLKKTSLGIAATGLPLLTSGCGIEGVESLPSKYPKLEDYEYDGEIGPESLFTHGVASGDPLTDRVILWTRITKPGADEVDVFWEISVDEAFTKRLNAGWAKTDASKDFTVKVDADGLYAGHHYYYRFWIDGRSSVIGRTKTAFGAGVRNVRIAFTSCSSYAHGYFHVYRHMAERDDLDVVLHLGDYIYEYGSPALSEDDEAPSSTYGSVRRYEPPHEIITLEDYRTRYAQYRRDPDLQYVHQRHPFICVWDDHELANDTWKGGAANHTPGEEGDFFERRNAAVQAYHEWIPIRDADDKKKIYRQFVYGDLVDLLMLDTRQIGRDEQVYLAALANEPEHRSLLGSEQEAWLEERLSTSTARWKVLGQQVMMATMSVAVPPEEGEEEEERTIVPFNLDAWDGYPAARRRLLEMIQRENVDNLIVLTGDIHMSWVNDIPANLDNYNRETGEGSVGVEFVTSSVSSPGLAAILTEPHVSETEIGMLAELSEQLFYGSPSTRYFEGSRRGFVVMDVNETRVQADYYLIDGINEDQGQLSHATSWEVSDGVPFAVEAAGPLSPER